MDVGIFCTQCGNALPAGARFCSRCGSSVAPAEATVQPTAAPTPGASTPPATGAPSGQSTPPFQSTGSPSSYQPTAAPTPGASTPPATGASSGQGTPPFQSAGSPSSYQPTGSAPSYPQTGYPSSATPPAPGMMPPAQAQPAAPKKMGKLPLIIGAAVLALVLLAGAGVFAFWMIGKPDRDYIAALKANNDYSFASDAEAIAHGKRVCAALDQGGDPEGSASDLAAVKSYCSKYSNNYTVLERKKIDGRVRLIDFTYGSQPRHFTQEGTTCTGANSFAYLNKDTAVVVTNSKGEEVARTTLGPGAADNRFECIFTFSLKITESKNDFQVKIGTSKPIAFSWDELSENGIKVRAGM